MNPVAENLTGWKLQDSKGKKLEEVFRIINPVTRAKLKDPVGVVLETGKMVSLSNQPVLCSHGIKMSITCPIALLRFSILKMRSPGWYLCLVMKRKNICKVKNCGKAKNG